MNITVEIANETIMSIAEVCSVCNATLWKQVEASIVTGAIHKAYIFLTVAGVVAVTLLIFGWFLAGWHMRKAKEVIK